MPDYYVSARALAEILAIARRIAPGMEPIIDEIANQIAKEFPEGRYEFIDKTRE